MKILEADKYLRWLCCNKKRISITPRLLEAINCLLEAATYGHDDEMGFKAFSRLWLYQMLHFDTVPTDEVAQKELVKCLLKSTPRTMYGLSETLRDAAVDRFIDGKKVLTLEDNNRILEIRNGFPPEELEKNLRQIFAQLKLQDHV